MPPARSAKSRATLASVQLDADLRSLLVHLPNSLYSPLLERGVAPQSIVVEVARADADGNEVISENESDIHKIYLGWTGMSAAAASAAASSSSQHPPLAISPAVPSLFNPPLSQQSTVRITLLRSPPLPTATQVDVTPLSPDDWEILSLHAGEVEESMLGQVRAAKAGMIIAAHVGRGGRTICKFRVDSTIPPTSANANAQQDLARAVRLSTDTEVVIAPRTRAPSAAEVAAAERYELNGKGADANGNARSTSNSARAASRQALDPAKARTILSKRLFRVLPLSANPSHRQYPTSALVASQDVRVLAVAFTPDATSSSGRCAITKIPCPSAPDVESGKQGLAGDAAAANKDKAGATAQSNGEQGAASPPHAAPARPTASGTFEAIGRQADEEQAAAGLGIPLRHVWLGVDLRRKLGIDDWDLVCFSAPSPGAGAGVKGSLPQANGAAENKAEDDEEAEGKTVLAGVDAIVSDCISTITGTFSSRELASTSSATVAFQGASALLLTGGPGSGKTALSNLLTQELAKPPHYVSRLNVDCTPHSETRLPVLRDLFTQWTSAAAWRAPCVLVLDNVDRVIPAEMEHVDSPRSRQLAEALVARIKDVVKRHEVFVLLTAQSSTSVHSLLNASHLLSTTVQLKPPNKEARKEILTHLVAQKADKGGLKAEGLNTITLAGQTEGYLPADMKDLVSRAVHQAAIRSAGEAVTEQAADKLSLTMADFTAAQEGFTPMSLRDVKLEKSSIAWSDIGGLQETRRVLRETLEWPTKYAAIFASCPLRLRSGLLLYGYPGCGKTLLASAVAKECGLNFISVKGPEILNKYIGASEKSVRDLFDRAQAAKPCVLFFDEFDSIAPKRGHDSTGVTDRVVNQLLTQMDGAEGLDGVYVLAATSRPDLIDSALLRPGRLDKSLLCDMPNKEDRVDIMKAVSNKVKLHPDVDLAKWAERTEGFSGADLQALLYNAHLETIHEAISAAEEGGEGGAASSSKADKGATSGEVRFVSLRAKKKEKAGEKGGEVTMSGAERQALTRRLGLILESSEASNAGSKGRSGGEGKDAGAKGKPNKAKALVTDAHLERSLGSTRPSVPEAERRRLERIYRSFSGEERPGDFPDGEASQLVGARESLM